MIIVIESFFLACKPLSHRYLITSEFVFSAFCQQFENLFFSSHPTFYIILLTARGKIQTPKRLVITNPHFSTVAGFTFNPRLGRSQLIAEGMA